MITFKTAAVLAALTTCALTAPVHAATFKPINGGKSIVMTGEIKNGDDERLATLVQDIAETTGVIPERVFLNSGGGTVTAGVNLAGAIVTWGLDTVVGATDI